MSPAVRKCGVAAACALLWLGGAGPAQPKDTHTKLTSLVKTARRNFTDVLHFVSGSAELARATIPLDPADWRAVAISRQSDDETCTLTLIGPQVVLLAAHCVDPGGPAGDLGQKPIAASVSFDNGVYAMDCTISPDYLRASYRPQGSRNSADFVLCRLNAAVPNISPEDIDTQRVLAKGDMLQLVGYGCKTVEIDASGFPHGKDHDDKLRIGGEPVDAVNVALTPPTPAIYVRTRADDNQPVLCPGDSGGPAMVSIPNTTKARRIVAVNAGFGPTELASQAAPEFYSYFASLNSNEFRDFLTKWVSQHGGIAVCGFNRAAGIGGCRT